MHAWIGRALVVLALSLVAHAIVLVVGQRALQVPPIGFGQGGLIEVTLRRPEAPPVEMPKAPVPERPATKAAPKPRPAPPAVEPTTAREPAPTQPAPQTAPEPEVAATTAAQEESATTTESPLPAEAAGISVSGEFDASGSALLAELASPPLGPASLPVSARYVYQTTDTRFPAVTGKTIVNWRFEEDRSYLASLVTTVFGVTLLELDSTGHVQRFGLAPERYTEKTIGRSAWATNFDWTTHRVTFSTKTHERELREGIQDRLSFQFQLMALGQRLLNRFRPGSSVVLAVGARDDVTTYRFIVVGNERLETGAGEFDTVKLERPKGVDGSDSRIEVWLAPSAAWLPVKLRFTDRRDQVTENVLAEIAIPAQ